MSAGIDPSMDMQAIATQLRHLAVAEWTENYCYYQDFLPGVDIQQEACKLLSSGFYYRDIAHDSRNCLFSYVRFVLLVIRTKATAVKQQLPPPLISCISLRMQTIAIPIMVAFIRYGSGHYDGGTQ